MWNVGGSLGKFFLVAGFLPALAFFAVVDLAIVPRFFRGQHLVGLKFLGITGVVYILGGTFLGFLLLALNTPIIKLYENGLLFSGRLKQRNEERHKQDYSALIARREDYRRAVEDGQDIDIALAKLEATYERIETLKKSQRLPYNKDHVRPTALGNAFAVTEEYSYERYGMDAMVYWPRLTAVIPEGYQSQIADLKTTLDFLLNLSLLAGIFGLGVLGVGAWFRTIPELVYGILTLVVAYGAYRLAVGSARELGELVMSCFDLFRGALLEKYGLSKPTRLTIEWRLWQSLASFIRRGEACYFPTELETKEKVDVTENM
jgi:hypothetical protein